MSYVEGVDYWVRLVEFPSMASPAVTVSNGDGTFTIYINTRFGPEKRAEGLRHELRHIEGEHFYRDEYGVCELEAAANGRRRGGGASGSTGTPAPCWRTSCAGPRPARWSSCAVPGWSFEPRGDTRTAPAANIIAYHCILRRGHGLQTCRNI